MLDLPAIVFDGSSTSLYALELVLPSAVFQEDFMKMPQKHLRCEDFVMVASGRLYEVGDRIYDSAGDAYITKFDLLRVNPGKNHMIFSADQQRIEMAFLVVLFVALALQQQMSNANFTEVKTNFSLLNDAAKKIKPRLVTAHKFYLDVRMNHSPKRPDAYEVVNRIYDYDDAFVTGFQLLKVNLDTNHHMILSSNHGTYFVWANRATGFTFPPDSGMLLRKGTKLTLTTHYLVPLNNDQSGFRLHLTRQNSLVSQKFSDYKDAKVDHSCSVRGGPAALYAVMVHTHKHGTKVEFNKRTIKTESDEMRCAGFIIIILVVHSVAYE
ncbi:unnamed protein product [Notodromas monacha]|uniref:Uncharacterized protein n=1 Tax=Notodromas monacha TaxID=399045 RepID=A0A7R9GBJ0_9CRUS|nr:unnamed protein product [Notodromas monacha]CAG0916412.1 unnamed protein product [Notodromas monacha]